MYYLRNLGLLFLQKLLCVLRISSTEEFRRTTYVCVDSTTVQKLNFYFVFCVLPFFVPSYCVVVVSRWGRYGSDNTTSAKLHRNLVNIITVEGLCLYCAASQ
jgi:choline-glycine betaine transporter